MYLEGIAFKYQGILQHESLTFICDLLRTISAGLVSSGSEYHPGKAGTAVDSQQIQSVRTHQTVHWSLLFRLSQWLSLCGGSWQFVRKTLVLGFGPFVTMKICLNLYKMIQILKLYLEKILTVERLNYQRSRNPNRFWFHPLSSLNLVFLLTT